MALQGSKAIENDEISGQNKSAPGTTRERFPPAMKELKFATSRISGCK